MLHPGCLGRHSLLECQQGGCEAVKHLAWVLEASVQSHEQWLMHPKMGMMRQDSLWAR